MSTLFLVYQEQSPCQQRVYRSHWYYLTENQFARFDNSLESLSTALKTN